MRKVKVIKMEFNINREECLKYIENTLELKIMKTKADIIMMYIDRRVLAECANHIYRNSKENTNLLMSDNEYDSLIKLLERMENDFPDMKKFFDKYYEKESLTTRVG